MSGSGGMVGTNELIASDDVRYDYNLANPLYSKKSSQIFTNVEGEQEKEDLTYNPGTSRQPPATIN